MHLKNEYYGQSLVYYSRQCQAVSFHAFHEWKSSQKPRLLIITISYDVNNRRLSTMYVHSTFIYVSGITATCIMINETSNHFSSHKSEQKISSLYSIDSIDDDDRLHPLSYLIVLHSIYIFGQSITRLVSFEVIIMTENNQSSPPPYANYASSGT